MYIIHTIFVLHHYCDIISLRETHNALQITCVLLLLLLVTLPALTGISGNSEQKPTSNSFETLKTVYTYSNCINQLLKKFLVNIRSQISKIRLIL